MAPIQTNHDWWLASLRLWLGSAGASPTHLLLLVFVVAKSPAAAPLLGVK